MKLLRVALLAVTAAMLTLTAPSASAAVVSVETWNSYPWQQVTQVSAGGSYHLVAVLGDPLKTYGRVWFYDNGQLVTTGYPNYGASDIESRNGRYQAVSPRWTPNAGTRNIEARQCSDSSCSYRVNFYKVTVVVS